MARVYSCYRDFDRGRRNSGPRRSERTTPRAISFCQGSSTATKSMIGKQARSLVMIAARSKVNCMFLVATWRNARTVAIRRYRATAKWGIRALPRNQIQTDPLPARSPLPPAGEGARFQLIIFAPLIFQLSESYLHSRWIAVERI